MATKDPTYVPDSLILANQAAAAKLGISIPGLSGIENISSTPKSKLLSGSYAEPKPGEVGFIAPTSGSGSIKDLSIGLAKNNPITQADITNAQSGGASLASRSSSAAAPTSSTSAGGSSSAGNPTGSNQTGIAGGSKRYSRYSDTPTDSPAPVKSVEQIQSEMSRGAQQEINALTQYYADLSKEQATINQGNDRSTASVNTLSGLAGSTEANVSQQKTTAQGQQAQKQITDQLSMQVQGVLSKIRTAAIQESHDLRTEARLDSATQEANRVTRLKEAQDNTKLLAASGATAEGYAQTDPEGYAHLVKQLGGEELLKATFTLNRPVEQVVERKIEGGKLIQIYENPLTGKSTIETLDLGLPVGYSKTIDAGDRILAVPDDWSGDPAELVTINKGMTPGQRQTAATAAAKGVGGGSGGQYASDLDAIIGATKATITSKFGQETFDKQMARTRDEADKINLVASVVLGKADAQTKSDFSNQAVGMKQIEKAIKMLDEGAKTGVLEAGAQYTYNLAGKDYDPKLAQINQLITSAIQPYRNSVTGAAWGDQEDGEYQMLFGSTKYSPAELRQRLVGVKEILASKSATALNSFVNPIGYYDNPFESGQYESNDSSLRSKVDQAGYNYDAMKADGLSDEEIRAAL